MNIDYERLYADYLIKKSERTRTFELDQFDSVQEHMSNWLQKVRGLTAEQAQEVINHSPIKQQIEKAGKDHL